MTGKPNRRRSRLGQRRREALAAWRERRSGSFIPHARVFGAVVMAAAILVACVAYGR